MKEKLVPTVAKHLQQLLNERGAPQVVIGLLSVLSNYSGIDHGT